VNAAVLAARRPRRGHLALDPMHGADAEAVRLGGAADAPASR